MLRLLVFSLLAVSMVDFSIADIITPAPGVGPFTWTRGDANTFYSGWDSFTDNDGNDLNGFRKDSTPELAGSNGPGGLLASLEDVSGNTGMSGLRNLYAPTLAPIFQSQIPSFDLGHGFTTQIVAQFRTRSAIIDLATLRMNGVVPTFTQDLGTTVVTNPNAPPIPGVPSSVTIYDFLASWDFGSTASSYQLDFSLVSGNSSLDQLHIDGAVTAVPEPGSIALLGMAAGMIGYRWNKRRISRRQV